MSSIRAAALVAGMVLAFAGGLDNRFRYNSSTMISLLVKMQISLAIFMDSRATCRAVIAPKLKKLEGF